MPSPSKPKTDLARLLSGVPSGLAAFLALLLLAHTGLMSALGRKSADLLRVDLAGPMDPALAFVYLDKASLDRAQAEFGVSWPWPRETYGMAADFLRRAGARAVVFDFLFTSPSGQGPQDDLTFARDLRAQGECFSGLYAGKEREAGNLAAFAAMPPLYQLPLSLGNLSPEKALDVDYPPAPLWGAFRGLGDVSFLSDPGDGLGRRARLLVDIGGRTYPSLALSAAWNLLGRPPLCLEGGRLWMGARSVPVDGGGTMDLLFVRPPSRAWPLFDLVSSDAALKEGRKPALDPSLFKGNVVLIGSSAPGLSDLRPTPMNPRKAPGLLVQATALDNLLQGRALRVVSLRGWFWPLLFVLCLGVAALAFRSPGEAVLVVPLLVLASALWVALACWLYASRAVLLPLAPPLLGLWLSFLLSALEHYLLESRRRRSIQTAFGQFLSPEVLRHLVADRRPLATGGEKQELTIFFSDLQGFTTFSEKLDPHDLVDLLNYYLTEMAEVVVGQCKGYVDKYEGDAIMAFWNAPVPVDNHALWACRAAWRCQRRLAEIQGELARRGLEAGEEGMVMRVGLNTGQAVVGLMGSARKLNYTLIGDAVNLASRLEGANKAYGSRVLLSEATRLAAGGGISTRELDLIRVKGKNEPTRIHELTGLPGEAGGLLSPEAAVLWEESLGRYRRRDFASALEGFRACLALRPQDRPSQAYARRCEEYLKDPPPPGWDGVYVMKTK